MEDEDIQIVHAIPGRVRLKIADIKNNPSLVRLIKNRLSAIAGIKRVEGNPITGTVLVQFDPQRVTPLLSDMQGGD